ncbi:DUF92 domain-containing protein [Chloroflexus sp.]|uniref:DUF92 domain-containing protein n=1 Tax=Chloroflexus sp. TaxID=1904827 RepID=UPI00262386FC|nr:DUF92 domain-containing protein [uncultured Chloroflexus sp.]
MVDLMQIGLGFMLSVVIGGVAFARRSLSESGWLGAIVVGTLTFGFGGWPWGLTLIVFFVTSSILSHYKESIKERRAAEKFSKGGRRDFFQTIANGGLGALCAVAYALSGQPWWLLAAFVGLMATVNADTWATELGVLSPHQPRLITTRRPVPPGTSGGVTALGTSAAAAGGLLIGIAMFLFTTLAAPGTIWPWWMIPAGLLGGLGGALFDSLLGATVQAIYVYPDGRETERRVARDGTPNRFLRGWRWMDNDLVNLISSVGGAIIAIVIAALAGGM